MSNPIIERTALSTVGEPLSIGGVINKTVVLLVLCAVSALGLFFYTITGGISPQMALMVGVGGMFAALIMGFILMAKPHLAKALAVPYALLEGLLVGGVSAYFMTIYPSVPLTALCATFITAAGMLVLYRSGLIKVTEKFRSVLMSAVIAIMILYAVQWVFIAFGSSIPMLFDGGIIAIGFSVFVVIIASLSLLLDFDNVERAAAAGVSSDMEWVLGIGILSTLVWMFIEFVRLLGFLEE